MPKGKNPVLYRSERLYLSPLSVDHAEYFVKWFNDPEIFGHLRDMTYQTHLAEQIRWVEETNRDPTQRVFSIFYIPDDQLIGDGGFMHINWEDRKAEVGLAIGEKKYQGMGLGAEALWLLCKYGFEELKLHNILGENYADNPIAISNARKIGLRYFGTRRQSRRIGDKMIDVHYSDMLPHELIKPEWKPKK
ncbi:MAG: GNAT family N-acetyltransferase [Deltaproteobacteria bacterium]|nr:GNAT family N-acetyltransferase [Deltaproteobacteria bacterium]